jgi:hypothetical protein
VQAIDDDFDPIVLQRVPAARLQAPPVHASPAQTEALSQYTGVYYNGELGVSWTLDIRGGKLVRRQWMFPAQELTPILPDTFSGDPAGRVDGFAVATSMVRPLQFSRCVPASPHDGGPVALGCKIH